jgi:hypothetical protein
MSRDSDKQEISISIGFIELLQLVTTSNYKALANSCTRLLTTTHTESFISSLAVVR